MSDMNDDALQETAKIVSDLQRLEDYLTDTCSSEAINRSIADLEQIRHSLDKLRQVFDILEQLLLPPFEKLDAAPIYEVDPSRLNHN